MPNQNPESWEEEFIEEAAAMEHDRWAHWQKYCHSTGIRDSSGIRLTIDSIERWERQINTPYNELTEKEKESDRFEVRKYLPLISSLLSKKVQEGHDRIVEGWKESNADNYNRGYARGKHETREAVLREILLINIKLSDAIPYPHENELQDGQYAGLLDMAGELYRYAESNSISLKEQGNQ